MNMDVLCIWMCYAYGCVMYMDVLCIWMCYVYGDILRRRSRRTGGRDGTGRDAFKTRTHTSESGGNKGIRGSGGPNL